MTIDKRLARLEGIADDLACPPPDALCAACALPRNRTVFVRDGRPPAADFRADCDECAATRITVVFVRPIIRAAAPDPNEAGVRALTDP